MMNKAYIGIGTNLGNRELNIIRACEEMNRCGITVLRQSSIENTKPVLYENQPDFLNTVVYVSAECSANELLVKLKGIEVKLGRVPSVEKGPRLIDLDILLYNNTVVECPDLVLPHPGIRERIFVLKHLLELNPDLSDPRDGVAYIEVYNEKKKHYC